MLRVQMRLELAKLHKTLGTTMIYVTHDQVEAMTLADRIVVLDRGAVAQIGAPLELYARPDNSFVAAFIGSPTMNFLPAVARRTGDALSVAIPGAAEIELRTRAPVGPAGPGPVEIGIRPEHLAITGPSDPHADLPATVQIVERLGNLTLGHLDTPAGPLVLEGGGALPIRPGERIGLRLDRARTHVFAADGRAL